MKRLLLLSLGMMLLPLQVYGDLMTWGHLFGAVVGLGAGVATERYYGVEIQKTKIYEQLLEEHATFCRSRSSDACPIKKWYSKYKQPGKSMPDQGDVDIHWQTYEPTLLVLAIAGGIMIDRVAHVGKSRTALNGVIDFWSALSMDMLGGYIVRKMQWHADSIYKKSNFRAAINYASVMSLSALFLVLHMPDPPDVPRRYGYC